MMSSGRSSQPPCCRGCALAASAIIVAAARQLAGAGRTSRRAHAAPARPRQFGSRRIRDLGNLGRFVAIAMAN
jgi:hypothetical protein